MNIAAETVQVAKTVVLFVLAAAAEIGGAWLVWRPSGKGRTGGGPGWV